MSLVPPVSLPTAQRIAHGRYLITAPAATTFFVGDTNTCMAPIEVNQAGRFYVEGPFYYFATGTVKIVRLPDKLLMSESASRGVAAPDGKDGPDMGS